MAIVTPATPVVTTEAQMMAVAVADRPLRTSLENMNHAMEFYSPALLQHVWTVEPNIARTSRFEVPVIPSEDAIRYYFSHLAAAPGAAAGSIRVEENSTGAWVSLAGAAGAAWNLVQGLANAYTHVDVIPALTTKLRIKYTFQSVYTPQGLLCVPLPGAPAVGIRPSGAVPFDDGLLATAGAPITTEHLSRSRRTAMALLRSRRQAVLSYVQEDGTAAIRYDMLAAWRPDGDWALVGRAVAWIPTKQATLRIGCIASVSAGALDVVRVAQMPGNTLALNASIVAFPASPGAVTWGDLVVYPDPDGRCELIIYARRTGAGRTTKVHAVYGWWRPTT